MNDIHYSLECEDEDEGKTFVKSAMTFKFNVMTRKGILHLVLGSVCCGSQYWGHDTIV